MQRFLRDGAWIVPLLIAGWCLAIFLWSRGHRAAPNPGSVDLRMEQLEQRVTRLERALLEWSQHGARAPADK